METLHTEQMADGQEHPQQECGRGEAEKRGRGGEEKRHRHGQCHGRRRQGGCGGHGR